jgi:hypothetical protein
MSSEQVAAAAMALPISGRVALAQALWESLDAGLEDTDEASAITDSIRRDAEISSGAVSGRSHAEVIETARRAVKCN